MNAEVNAELILKPVNEKFDEPVFVPESDDTPLSVSGIKDPDSHIPPDDKCLSSKEVEERLAEMGLTQNNHRIVNLISRKGVQEFYKADEPVLHQGDEGDAFFIILRGSVSVRINNRPIATRNVGDFFGETCVLSSLRRRNATILAEEDTNLLKMSRETMRFLFRKHPDVLSRVALTLTDRLNDRSVYIRRPNDKPVVFVGSSNEGAKLIETIEKDPRLLAVAKIQGWKGIFNLTENTLYSLIRTAETVDYALLIFTRDDWSLIRRRLGKTPRANVVFELGLFMGALGRERTIVMAHKGFDKSNLLIPSDLAGITFLTYDNRKDTDAPLGDAIAKLVETIDQYKAK